MKFEKVKVGDIVFVQIGVSYGWNNCETFFVPRKVARTTKTQFITEQNERFRKDGRGLGDSKYSNVYIKGEKPCYYSEKIVVDETKEMNEFISKLNLERNIKKDLEKLKLNYNSDLSTGELSEIECKLKEINKLLKAE